MMRFLVGDVFDRLVELPDGSVDLVVTSPPFLALRSYLPADHPDKHKEIGSEPTPAAFIDTLLAVTAELRRVLTSHGSIAIELGDTYAGGGGTNHLYEGSNKDGGFNGSADFGTIETPRRATDGWPQAKCKTLIPELYRLALAYGHNPLTGQESPAGRWLVRNVVTWCRPNPPVGALGDKWRPATSDVVIACTSKDRYWDDLATRNVNHPERMGRSDSGGGTAPKEAMGSGAGGALNDYGAPLLDWWKLTTGGYTGSHYACVDDQTEALTPHGWKRNGDLKDGDLIAAYQDGHVEWQPAKFVRYDVTDEELVVIEKQQTSQRLTTNHRMLVRSRKRPDPFVKLAGDVSSGYDLPLSAPWDDTTLETGDGPGVAKAELLGWFITEGSARPKSRQAHIYQSQSANSEKVDHIRHLLDTVEADYYERTRTRDNSIEKRFVVRNSPLADWLRAHHKRLPIEYVWEWSHDEAQALFDGLVDGDGHRRKSDGRISFIQKDQDTVEAFQCLAIRLGYRAVAKQRLDGGFIVYVSVNEWVTLRGPDGKKAAIPRETYSGVVWCPQVQSSFWLARREGKPFITGNTFPTSLVEPLVKAMAPTRVCVECGKPSRRIVGEPAYVRNGKEVQRNEWSSAIADGKAAHTNKPDGATTRVDTTLGFTDCGHDTWRPALILDPFAGTGTTLLVAHGHGHHAIGIDLDPRNAALAEERCGPMFLTIENHSQ